MSTPEKQRRFSASSSFDTDPTSSFDTPEQAAAFEAFFGTSPTAPDATPTPDQTPAQSTPDVAPSPEHYDYHDMPLPELRQVFTQNPDLDKGIGNVLDAITTDIDERFHKAPLEYENEIIDLARSVAVRGMENKILEGIDLSEGDNPYGVLERLQHKLVSDAEASTDDDTKNKRIRTAVGISRFMKRHEQDDEDTAIQAAAAELYTVSKDLMERDFPISEETRQPFDRLREVTLPATLDLEGKHKDYIHTAHVIKQLVPQLETEQSGETEDTSMDALRERVSEARAGLAALDAKRQKKMLGFDRLNPNAPGKTEAQRIKRQYDAAVQELIAAEIKEKVTTDGQFADVAAANLYIATRTVNEATALDEATIEQYAQNNSKLGKVINYITGRDETGKRIALRDKETKKYNWKQIRRVAGVSVATALIGMSLGAVTVATGGAGGIAAAAVTSAYSGGRAWAAFEAKGRYNRTQKKPGLLDTQKVIRSLSKLDEKHRQTGADYIEYNPETQEYDDVPREVALARVAASMIGRAAEKETRKQKAHVLKRAIGAAAFGATIGFGLHGIKTSFDSPVKPPYDENRTMRFGWWDLNGDGSTPHVGDLPGTPDGLPNAGPDINIPDGLPGDMPMPSTEFAPNTFFAQSGDGFYDILKNMGVEASQRDDVLQKASSELFKRGFAYPMQDGLPGISRAGNLPQGAIDILVKAAGK